MIFSGKIVPTNCLWVGNIPLEMKRRDLEQAFARYGEMKSFDYETGDPTAIVTFNEIEDAIKARAKMSAVTKLSDGKKVRADSEPSDSSRRGERVEEVFSRLFSRILFSFSRSSDRLSRSTDDASVRYRSRSGHFVRRSRTVRFVSFE